MPDKIVKVIRPVVTQGGDNRWTCYDEKREHIELFDPDEWMRKNMVGMTAYFLARWSIDRGWQFRRRIKDKLYW